MISQRISDDIPPNENFEYGCSHSNVLLQSSLKLECCKPHKAAKGACHPTKCDVINDVKIFPTVYRMIYCCKYLTLSNQTLCYKISALEWYFIATVNPEVVKYQYLQE